MKNLFFAIGSLVFHNSFLARAPIQHIEEVELMDLAKLADDMVIEEVGGFDVDDMEIDPITKQVSLKSLGNDEIVDMDLRSDMTYEELKNAIVNLLGFDQDDRIFGLVNNGEKIIDLNQPGLISLNDFDEDEPVTIMRYMAVR